MALTPSPSPSGLNEATREELLEFIRQQGQLIEQLRKQIEELLRKSHRQANPFSKNQPKSDPKRPGRKPGEGSCQSRPSPPEQPSDLRVEASTPDQCPRCGGPVEWERVDTATVTEIAAQPAPVVTRYSVPVCRCRQCGKNVRGKAPGLAGAQWRRPKCCTTTGESRCGKCQPSCWR